MLMNLMMDKILFEIILQGNNGTYLNQFYIIST